MASVTIAADASVISFIQVWTMPDPTHQQRWLQTMHERIGALIPQPGFVSMTLHPSLDGTGTVVYAQWRSQEELEMAVNQPQAKDGHQALAQWGESAGTVYHTDSVYTPETPHRVQITAEATVATFINVWKTPTVKHQRQLIEAMNGEMNSMTQKPGFVSLTIHASLDGQSVVVYAQWRSREDFDRAIAHDEQAMNYPTLKEGGVSNFPPSSRSGFSRFLCPSCFIEPVFLRLPVFEVELRHPRLSRLIPNPGCLSSNA